MFHPRFRHDIQTTAAVFYLTSSVWTFRSLVSLQSAGERFRFLVLPSPHRIFAVTRGFQTTTQELSVSPFLPRHYRMTHVLLLPFITTVWTPVVLAIMNLFRPR